LSAAIPQIQNPQSKIQNSDHRLPAIEKEDLVNAVSTSIHLTFCLNFRLAPVQKTGGLMISIEHKKRWYLTFATIHNIVAPRRKSATGLGF